MNGSARTIVAPACPDQVRFFQRECTLRQQVKSITDATIAAGAGIAATEIQKLRFEHEAHCSRCAKYERAQIGCAA